MPEAEERFQLNEFQAMLNEYAAIDAAALSENPHHFLREVGPVAAAVGINLCIHPDGPPFPLLGR